MTLFPSAYSAPPPPTPSPMGGVLRTSTGLDEGYIMRHLEELRTRWAEAHNRFATADVFYMRRYQVWPKHPDRAAIRPPTARSIVDHAVDTQIGHIPSVHRMPVGDGDQHRQDADRIEVALKAILENAQKHETVLPYKLLAKHLTLYGYGVLYGPTLADPYRMMRDEPKMESGEPEATYRMKKRAWDLRRRNWNPIRVQCPHPTQVFLDPTEKVPTFGIYLRRVAAKDLKSHIEKRSLRIPGEARRWLYARYDHEICDVLEYWTPEYLSVMFQNGSMLWQEFNRWGIVPFAHGFSGWGMDFSYGFETNQWSYAANMAVGILESLHDTIRAEAQVRSSRHNLLMNLAWAPMASRDPQALMKGISGEQIVQGRPDDHGVIRMVPDLDPAIAQVGEELADDIQLTVPTRVLSGGREPGVSTVGQTAIMSAAARRKFDTIAHQMQDMVTLVSENILHLVDSSSALEGRIGAAGHELTKKSIHGVYDCKVVFEVRDPVIDMQRRQLAMAEYQAGLIDTVTYLTQAGYENISEIRKGRIRDFIEAHPEVHHKLVQAVAREEGIEDLVDSIYSQMEAADAQGQTPLDASVTAPTPTAEQVSGSRGIADAGLRQPLTGDTAKPQRIDVM